MKEPLVSICIPNYNNAKYLDQCIQSAINQTYKNKQIIFVDDASTDDSVEIACKYEDEIMFYRNPRNVGQPKNTNRALWSAMGEYIVILHSDDALVPEFVEQLLPLLEENENVGMAVGERILIDENNQQTLITPFYNTDCIIPGREQAKVFLKTSFLPCQVLVRRSLLNFIGGVNERHIVNLDGLLWFTCSLYSDLAYIQDPVCLYRIHPEQATAQYNRTIQHMMEYYITLMEMFRLAKGIPEIEAEFDAAVKRVAEVTLRYGQEVQDPELAYRYQTLASVFYPYMLVNTWQKGKRGFSYDPPPGSIRR